MLSISRDTLLFNIAKKKQELEDELSEAYAQAEEIGDTIADLENKETELERLDIYLKEHPEEESYTFEGPYRPTQEIALKELKLESKIKEQKKISITLNGIDLEELELL